MHNALEDARQVVKMYCLIVQYSTTWTFAFWALSSKEERIADDRKHNQAFPAH